MSSMGLCYYRNALEKWHNDPRSSKRVISHFWDMQENNCIGVLKDGKHVTLIVLLTQKVPFWCPGDL